MKSLIEIYTEILTEKLYNIDSDVDFLYKKLQLDDVVNGVAGGNFNINSLKLKGGSTLGTVKSSVLKTSECKAAHSVKPVTITASTGVDGRSRTSHYNPTANLIHIFVNTGIINTLQSTDDMEYLPPYQQKMIVNEFSEARIKGVIKHELSHWINDSIHNFHVTNTLKFAHDHNINVASLWKKKNVNATPIEVDALIHSISAIKNNTPDEYWDAYTLQTLFYLYPPLESVRRSMDADERQKWLRDLSTRMHREGLLGKKMRSWTFES